MARRTGELLPARPPRPTAGSRERLPAYGAGVHPDDATSAPPPPGRSTPRGSGPAVLQPHDPRWTVVAQDRLEELRHALAPLVPDLAACSFDHIGSTAVPGLAAKGIVDLQARLPHLPEAAALDAALAPLGWEPAPGSRPDSPGVTRDLPAPGDDEPEQVWAKRLFASTGTSTGAAVPAILHLRLTASPFGARTLAFRDRLRAEPDLREAYERLKTGLAAAHAGDPDYDDYTRGKTTFIQAAGSS